MYTKIINDLAVLSKRGYINICEYVAGIKKMPVEMQAQIALFGLGMLMITGGIMLDACAQGVSNIPNQSAINYNDVRVVSSYRAVLAYIEGSFGALIMVASGIGAIMSAAFGNYKAALGLMAVAIGSFILRSLIFTFFNVERDGQTT